MRMGMGLGIKPSQAIPFSNNYYLALDGTGDYVDTGLGQIQTYLGGSKKNMTFSVWVRPASLSQARTVIAADWNAGGADESFVLEFSNTGTITGTFGQVGSAGAGLVPSTTLAVDTWTFLTLTYEDSDVSTIYVNGVSEDTGVYGNVQAESGNDFTIGRAGAYADFYFNGSIDEIAIYNSVLEVADITTLYGDGTPEGCGNANDISNLVGYWRMENNGDDSSDNNNTLTTVGDAGYVRY